MCTLPALLDCGSLIPVFLFKTDPEIYCFRYWQSFNSPVLLAT